MNIPEWQESLTTKSFVVCPSFVRSIQDGDKHFISYEQLINLYNVDPAQCVEFVYGLMPFYPSHLKFLRPRYFGDYLLSDGTTNV